jgi:hypothetical protein
VWIYPQSNIKNIILTWVHNIKTHTQNIMIIEHIGQYRTGTRLSSEIPHTRTDLASWLMQLAEHWTCGQRSRFRLGLDRLCSATF